MGKSEYERNVCNQEKIWNLCQKSKNLVMATIYGQLVGYAVLARERVVGLILTWCRCESSIILIKPGYMCSYTWYCLLCIGGYYSSPMSAGSRWVDDLNL